MQNHNPQATSNALGKRKAVAADVVEVAPPTKVPAAAPAAADELDDDLQYIGRSGQMALQDFPHARENCTVKPFDPTNEDKCFESCPNCYCYVCDTPVSACDEWDNHCMARHDLPRWQHARAAAKATAHAKGAADAQQQQPAASRQGAMLLGPDELLSAVESIHPVETPEPAGLRADVRLRPYQKQSLAFALELERADDSSLLGREGSVRGGFICDEMGMGKTAVCTALVLARPFSETTTTTSETTTTPQLPQLPLLPFQRDAWGSASASAPLPVKHEASGAASSSSSATARRKLKGRRLKTTLVVAPNTLIGQWHDEVRAFAPRLVTRVLYGAAGKQVTAENIGEIDLLITTPHTKLPVGVAPDAVVFHRLIVDESHLLDAGRGAASAWGPAQLQALLNVQAPHVWLVTGTPFVLEGGALTFEKQLRLLGHHGEGLRLGGRALSDAAVPDIQRLMIRHSKAQRIHGEAALSLPDADVQTTMLELTPDERALYDLAACADGLPDWLHAQYARTVKMSVLLAPSGHHGLTQHIRSHREAVAFQPEAAQVETFAASDHPPGTRGRGSTRSAPTSARASSAVCARARAPSTTRRRATRRARRAAWAPCWRARRARASGASPSAPARARRSSPTTACTACAQWRRAASAPS